MHQQAVIHPHNNILPSNKKDELFSHTTVRINLKYTLGSKPDLKCYILHKSIYMVFWKRRMYRNQRQNETEGRSWKVKEGVDKE